MFLVKFFWIYNCNMLGFNLVSVLVFLGVLFCLGINILFFLKIMVCKNGMVIMWLLGMVLESFIWI